MDQTAKNLLAWYDRHARALPWRKKTGEKADPYAVWLSEIMLQQTTVAAVGPYFQKFLSAWPDVTALAEADDEAVMRAWAGLGYYARARNLLAAARKIVENGGVFPDTEEELRGLPGVGTYTAAAVAAIAFGRRAVVVDGNVERVVARLAAIDAPMPAAKAQIRAFTDAMTPQTRPGDFAQAMMDLGATICTPTKPACIVCPLSRYCRARAMGAAEDFPKRAPKKPRPKRFGVVFVAQRDDGAVLLQTRPPKGLLGGMAEFPGGEWRATPPLFTQTALAEDGPLPLAWRKLPGEVVHVFTHFALHLTVCVARAPQGQKPSRPAAQSALGGETRNARWVAAADLAAEALPSLMRKVALHAGLDARRQTVKKPSADPPAAKAQKNRRKPKQMPLADL